MEDKGGKSSTPELSKNVSKIQRNKNAAKDKFLQELRKRISKLPYEESLKQLDLLLEQLKNESLPVQELQRAFLEGSLHIEHCAELLDQVEQEVMEINIE